MLQHRAAFFQFPCARMARFQPSRVFSTAAQYPRNLPLSLDLPSLGVAMAEASPSPWAAS
jgi:hypothetical protein